MKGRPSLLWLVAAICLASAPAQAFRFGTDETLHRIEDVRLKGAEDEALYLGYLTRVRNVLLGLYVEDRGYVLGITDQSGRFYPMPAGEQLKSFQRTGLLPDPLPAYRLGASDYILGYSLWWALGVVGLVMLVGRVRRRPAPSGVATLPRPTIPIPPQAN